MTNKRFFCLRGFMKSGTNWLGGLLNTHPQIRCLGEFHWEQIMGPLRQRIRNSELYGDVEYRRANIAHFETAIKKCLVAAAGTDAHLIGDRTPCTLAPVVIRNAPHISIIRDGRDVLVSRAFHLFNNPGVSRLFQRNAELRQDLQRFQEDPWFFKKNPERLLDNRELVQVSAQWWREHLESDRRTVESHSRLPVLFVKYEDLHADLRGVLAGVFEFLEVDPNLAEEPAGKLQPGFETETPNDFFRKGVVGDWQNYFNDQVRTWFKEQAQEELVRYNYVETDQW